MKEKFEKAGLDRRLAEEVSNFIIDRNYLYLEKLIFQAVQLGGLEVLELIKHI